MPSDSTVCKQRAALNGLTGRLSGVCKNRMKGGVEYIHLNLFLICILTLQAGVAPPGMLGTWIDKTFWFVI